MKIKISLAQINTKLGNINQNIKIHEKYIKKAIDEKSNLIVFPELSISGYYLQDGALEVSLKKEKVLEIFYDLSQKIDISLGFPEIGEDSVTYISQIYLSKGKILHNHRKIYPPNHGMFDDLKFFGKGKEVKSFDTDFGKAGMLICRDFFHPSLALLHYLQNIELLILTSAIPVRGSYRENGIGIYESTEKLLSIYSLRFHTFIVFVNRVGFEEGICFMGGSMAKDPSGKTILSLPLIKEDFESIEINFDEIKEEIFNLPLRREEEIDIILNNLKEIKNG
ncbi:MAG TPA: nitrilase-related carbon-nitrogen hydrolase [Caldisericia bacterium]|nr:nitrilase-related carbon-nitrogen hydrolase [Caldisericia bacterium]HRT37133.1 nitrilase-related carbon-nitrogen hydrolase [Caldisericia bacterium]